MGIQFTCHRSLRFEKWWDWAEKTLRYGWNWPTDAAKVRAQAPLALARLKERILSLQHFPNLTELFITYKVSTKIGETVFAAVFAELARQPFFERLKVLEFTLYFGKSLATPLEGNEDFLGDSIIGHDIHDRIKGLSRRMSLLEVARISVNGLAVPWDPATSEQLSRTRYYYYPFLMAPKLRKLIIETDQSEPSSSDSDREGMVEEVGFVGFEGVQSLNITRDEGQGTRASMKRLVAMFPNLEELRIKLYNKDSRSEAKLDDYDSIPELRNLKILELPWPATGMRGSLPPNDLENFVTRWLETGADNLEEVTFSGARNSDTIQQWLDILTLFWVDRIDSEPGWEVRIDPGSDTHRYEDDGSSPSSSDFGSDMEFSD
ncbi:hypothetical protein TWF281_007582 [Arthrobotrys megalospora]